MREGQRIVAILVVSLGLSGLLLGGMGVLWWKNQGVHWVSEGKQAFSEGQDLGAMGDSRLCLDRSLDKAEHCVGLGCEIATIAFLNACLAHADPAPEFCSGVPSKTEIFASVSWRLERCEEKNFSRRACENVYASVQHYCEGLRGRGALETADGSGALDTAEH